MGLQPDIIAFTSCEGLKSHMFKAAWLSFTSLFVCFLMCGVEQTKLLTPCKPEIHRMNKGIQFMLKSVGNLEMAEKAKIQTRL
jgi:hypothetical protein